MQLTNNEEDKIFGMYLPCDVLCGKQSGWIHSQKQHYADLRFYVENKDRGLKLLVTQLSKISDEHAIEVAKITDVVTNTGLLVRRGIDCVSIYDKYNDTVDTKQKDGIVEFHTDSLDIFYWSEGKVQSSDLERHLLIIDFLRSKGYALPFRNASLFDLGIAIEK